MSANPELGLKGKGVEPVRIEKIDKIAATYIKLREEASKWTSKASEARGKLIEAMHEHEDQLADSNGDLLYKFDGAVVSLVAGVEKLKVEEIKEAKG